MGSRFASRLSWDCNLLAVLHELQLLTQHMTVQVSSSLSHTITTTRYFFNSILFYSFR